MEKNARVEYNLDGNEWEMVSDELKKSGYLIIDQRQSPVNVYAIGDKSTEWIASCLVYKTDSVDVRISQDDESREKEGELVKFIDNLFDSE